MSSRALSSLWRAAPADHPADPVARSTPSTTDYRTALGRAGTPSELADAATATMEHDLVSAESCRFGTLDCTRRPVAVVTACYTPATPAGEPRPMCAEHALVLVEAITRHGDSDMSVLVEPLRSSPSTMT